MAADWLHKEIPPILPLQREEHPNANRGIDSSYLSPGLFASVDNPSTISSLLFSGTWPSGVSWLMTSGDFSSNHLNSITGLSYDNFDVVYF